MPTIKKSARKDVTSGLTESCPFLRPRADLGRCKGEGLITKLGNREVL